MLGEKISKAISRIFYSLKLNESNIKEPLAEIRNALIESEVKYSVANSIIDLVKSDILKNESKITPGCSPSDHLMYCVYNRIKQAFGSNSSQSCLTREFKGLRKVLVCGLQGHGKTTSIGKLIHYFKNEYKKTNVLVTCCDRNRPAGDLQLKNVTESAGGKFLESGYADKDIVKHAKNANDYAIGVNADVLIVDTAGRMNVQNDLINELCELKSSIEFDETVLVISANIGQESKVIYDKFDKSVGVDSLFVSMMDSSVRLGTILSMGENCCKKIVWEGIGEKFVDYQVFNPVSAADRVLGRPDIINLVSSIKSRISSEEKEEIEKKIIRGTITFDDIDKMIVMMGRIGSVGRMLEMFGVKSKSVRSDDVEKKTKTARSIIKSMTPRERSLLDHLSFSRKKRISRGSGKSIEDINSIIKTLEMAKKMKNLLKGEGIKNPAQVLQLMKGFR